MVGAPACVSNLEELIALGVKKTFVCGKCGVLDRTIDDAHLIIPTSAARDEGTSYHYLPVSDKVELDTYGIKVIEEVFKSECLSAIPGSFFYPLQHGDCTSSPSR